MSADQRDTLEVLRFELYLLQQGAYREDGTRSGAPLSYFRDSPTCLNFAEADSRRSCRPCLLTQFIPGNYQNETAACRKIPLDANGNTIASLDRRYNRAAVERAVIGWLQETVAKLERERQQELVTHP